MFQFIKCVFVYFDIDINPNKLNARLDDIETWYMSSRIAGQCFRAHPNFKADMKSYI